MRVKDLIELIDELIMEDKWFWPHLVDVQIGWDYYKHKRYDIVVELVDEGPQEDLERSARELVDILRKHGFEATVAHRQEGKILIRVEVD